MGNVQVEHNQTTDETQAITHLADDGLHTLTLDIEPVSNTAHWHSFDAVFYLLSGSLTLTDSTNGAVHQCAAGSKITVPAQTLHAEHSENGYRVALGTSVTADAFGDPVNRAPDTLPAA